MGQATALGTLAGGHRLARFNALGKVHDGVAIVHLKAGPFAIFASDRARPRATAPYARLDRWAPPRSWRAPFAIAATPRHESREGQRRKAVGRPYHACGIAIGALAMPGIRRAARAPFLDRTTPFHHKALRGDSHGLGQSDVLYKARTPLTSPSHGREQARQCSPVSRKRT